MDGLCEHADSDDGRINPHITTARCVWGQAEEYADHLRPINSVRSE